MEINFRGKYITVEVTSFEAQYPAKTNCYSDDGYEGGGDLEYDILSGNDLLDELLAEDYGEEMDALVLEKLNEDNY